MGEIKKNITNSKMCAVVFKVVTQWATFLELVLTSPPPSTPTLVLPIQNHLPALTNLGLDCFQKKPQNLSLYKTVQLSRNFFSQKKVQNLSLYKTVQLSGNFFSLKNVHEFFFFWNNRIFWKTAFSGKTGFNKIS